VIFDGRNGGTVELLDNVLVIRRKGAASFLTQGLKGEKRIPYSSITSVQFKEAGLTTGYIQFGVAGGIESRGGVWNATTDENTVLFTKEAVQDFRRLRDIIEERAAAARNGPAVPPQAAAPSNVSEELGRLADLKDRGVLTESEFAEQKARLLQKPTNGVQPNRPQESSARPASSSTIRSRISQEPVPQKRKSAFGRVAGVGCLVVLGIVVLLTMIGSQVDKGANSVDAAGNESGNSSAAADVSLEDLPLAVSAKELWSAYQGNEASAQGYFGKRKLYVTGTVDRVQLDFLDHPEILLRTPNEFEAVQAELAENARDQASSFDPGDKARLLCEDVSEVAATPILKDCRNAPTGIKTQPVKWRK